jgi:predicted lysophospholipase L1 biosynthesis ABC-type transport system permease subunit
MRKGKPLVTGSVLACGAPWWQCATIKSLVAVNLSASSSLPIPWSKTMLTERCDFENEI